MRKKVVPAILDADSKNDRKKLHVLLIQLAHIGKVLSEFDIDGSYEDAFRDGIKQFLFKGVTTHHIYKNLIKMPYF